VTASPSPSPSPSPPSPPTPQPSSPTEAEADIAATAATRQAALKGVRERVDSAVDSVFGTDVPHVIWWLIRLLSWFALFFGSLALVWYIAWHFVLSKYNFFREIVGKEKLKKKQKTRKQY
jgi:Domain of unknown function (DUF4750)